MKWCSIFSPPVNEYVIYHIEKWWGLILLYAFIPKYYLLHFFNHRIPHIIHQMKNRCICVSHSNHIINRFCEFKNEVNLAPPHIIQSEIFHISNFSNIIFLIRGLLLTNDHGLKILFYVPQPFKHDQHWSKSCFSNSK